MANWKRTLNHEGVTRGAQALLALGCVLALGWQADWQDELMSVVLGVLAMLSFTVSAEVSIQGVKRTFSVKTK